MDPFKEANEIVRFNSGLDLTVLATGGIPPTSYPSTAADGFQLPRGSTRVLVAVNVDTGEPDTDMALFGYRSDVDTWFRVNGATLTVTEDGVTERYDVSGFDRVTVAQVDGPVAGELYIEASYDPDA